MFISLFNTLRATGIPCTLRELLDLIAAVEKNLGFADMEKFYFLSRAILVKDEKHYDKFDRAFDIYFKGIESLDDILEMLIPEVSSQLNPSLLNVHGNIASSSGRSTSANFINKFVSKEIINFFNYYFSRILNFCFITSFDQSLTT